MEFKNIAIIGAGAVGAYFIYGFDSLKDISYCVVAEGARKERLAQSGVVINDQTYYPTVKTPEEAKGADLVLVCTKYQTLDSTLPMLETICTDQTVVVSLLNGVDSEERIAERIGENHLLYSVMRISSERRDGKIRFNPEKTVGVTVGEKNKVVTPRVLAFNDMLLKAGLHVKILDDIVLDQWSKFAGNIFYNLPQAVLGVGFGAYQDSEYVNLIKERLYEEVCQIAKAEGIAPFEKADWSKVCVPQARFSTLQDLDAKRQTEVDMFTGTMMKLAKKHGVPVPFCEYTHYAIKALEEKNAGKFDY